MVIDKIKSINEFLLKHGHVKDFFKKDFSLKKFKECFSILDRFVDQEFELINNLQSYDDFNNLVNNLRTITTEISDFVLLCCSQKTAEHKDYANLIKKN
jgi:hypothetical protein